MAKLKTKTPAPLHQAMTAVGSASTGLFYAGVNPIVAFGLAVAAVYILQK